ncbi:hypothetical protein [Exiguobacterium acetylicum]
MILHDPLQLIQGGDLMHSNIRAILVVVLPAVTTAVVNILNDGK